MAQPHHFTGKPTDPATEIKLIFLSLGSHHVTPFLKICPWLVMVKMKLKYIQYLCHLASQCLLSLKFCSCLQLILELDASKYTVFFLPTQHCMWLLLVLCILSAEPELYFRCLMRHHLRWKNTQVPSAFSSTCHHASTLTASISGLEGINSWGQGPASYSLSYPHTLIRHLTFSI